MSDINAETSPYVQADSSGKVEDGQPSKQFVPKTSTAVQFEFKVGGQSFVGLNDQERAEEAGVEVSVFRFAEAHNQIAKIINRGERPNRETIRAYLNTIENLVLSDEQKQSLLSENNDSSAPLLVALHKFQEMGKDRSFNESLLSIDASRGFLHIVGVDQVLIKLYSDHLTNVANGRSEPMFTEREFEVLEAHINSLNADEADNYFSWAKNDNFPEWVDDNLKNLIITMQTSYDNFITKRDKWRNKDLEGSNEEVGKTVEERTKAVKEAVALTTEKISELMNNAKGDLLDKVKSAITGAGEDEEVEFDGNKVTVVDLKKLQEQLEKDDNSLLDIVLYYANEIRKAGDDDNKLKAITDSSKMMLEGVIKQLPEQQQVEYHQLLSKALQESNGNKRKLATGILSAGLSVLGFGGDPIEWIIKELATASGGR